MAAEEFRARVLDAIDGKRFPSSNALATRADVKPQTLHKFLTTPGRRISRETVERLAVELGWPVPVALAWADLCPPPQPTSSEPMQAIQTALFCAPWPTGTAEALYGLCQLVERGQEAAWRDRFEEAIVEVRAERFYGRGESGGAPFTPDEVEEATISRIRSRIFKS